MSLSSPSSERAEYCTVYRCRRCMSSSELPSSSSVKPMMAFIGVRISWLMLARKALFAAAARSARSLALSNSPSISR
ncbi:hypothetical protein D9M71_343640 [compost metagenome]